MNLYIYAKSSHRDGLEHVRRCAALAHMLDEFKPTLCTGDYRAASMAKSELGVRRTMGIDAIGNLRQSMERLDVLLYDGDPLDEEVLAQMEAYCSLFYGVGDAIDYDIVDPIYFEHAKNVRKYGVFFADDDYANSFYDFVHGSAKHDAALLMGHYFFMGNEKRLGASFSEVHESEEYEAFVKSTEYLLCASVQSALESLACGNKPVFFARGDKEAANTQLLEKYGIPVACGESFDALMEDFYAITQNYPQIKNIEKFDISNVKKEIAAVFKEYGHIAPSIDFGLVSSEKE